MRNKDGDDKVGYGSPPKDKQFRKGTSGNPKGRPKKRKQGWRDLAKHLNKPVFANKSGQLLEMPPFEANLRILLKKALDNNHLGSALEFIQLCEKYEVMPTPPPLDRERGVLHIPANWKDDEWLRMLEIHGPPPWPGERSGLPGNIHESKKQEE